MKYFHLLVCLFPVIQSDNTVLFTSLTSIHSTAINEINIIYTHFRAHFSDISTHIIVKNKLRNIIRSLATHCNVLSRYLEMSIIRNGRRESLRQSNIFNKC